MQVGRSKNRQCAQPVRNADLPDREWQARRDLACVATTGRGMERHPSKDLGSHEHDQEDRGRRAWHAQRQIFTLAPGVTYEVTGGKGINTGSRPSH